MAVPRHKTAILGKVEDLLEFLKNDGSLKEKSIALSQDIEIRGRINYYSSFLNLDKGEQYYRNVTICKLIYYDLCNKTNLHLLSQYAPGIENIDQKDILKVRFYPKYEEFVIFTKDKTYTIYKGDIQYIYRFYCQVPDIQEFELVYDGDGVFTFSKFNDEDKIPVFEQ
ncbi:MAG: hypothetical protein ACXQS3_07115 [Candidatus Methanofastidiosia archaeon]